MFNSSRKLKHRKYENKNNPPKIARKKQRDSKSESGANEHHMNYIENQLQVTACDDRISPKWTVVLILK